MLAATRSKPLKWASDPQNKTWLNDDSRFGVKMLEKMGWKKGKGLGANEDGSTENVKVSLKSNQRGLGCSAEYENNWVAHQDDFQSLLNQLNSTTEATPAPETSKSIATLERKSSQQKRVHYAKFTRGKDLSNRSEQDMAAIFGTKPTTASAASSKSEDEEGAKTKKKKRKQEVEMSNTHTSQYSVDEYFKMRVVAKLNSGQTDVKQSTADNVEDKPLKRKKKRANAEATCDVTEKPVKRKKRRDDVTNSSEPKSIKRKKTRVETTDCDVTRGRSGEVDSTNRDVTSGSEVKSKKDKKKKKKKKPAAAAE